MVTPRRHVTRIGVAYIFLCATLAFFAIFTPDPHYVGYYSLVILTLPLSLLALPVQFFITILFFGAEGSSLAASGVIFVSWIGVATAEWLLGRALMRSVKRGR